MKKIFQLLPLLIIIILIIIPILFAQTSITIYNQNFATVRTNLSIQLKKGENLFSFSDIPSAIEPTSVHLTPLKKSDKIVIALQNFEYDLANTTKILDKYLDREIEIVAKNGELFSGILKSFDHENIVIQRRDNKGISMIQREEIQNINLEKMPENFYTKPTLNWELISNRSGDCKIKLSYITRNITWDAQYVGILSPDEKSLNLSSWISLDNRSGKAYKQVDLKLMAGDVHLAPEYRPMYRDEILFEAKGLGVPKIVEKEFFEYHLYTVKERKIDINNNQQKQLSLFDPTDVSVEKIFRYNCNSSGNVNVLIKFKNEEEYGLGIPLPKGKVRIFKKESEDEEEFIGEDRIAHTPKNEEVELKVGTAFDIKGECILVDTERPTKKTRREKYEIELRNQKNEDVTIEVLKKLGTNWTIEKSDEEYEKKDAYTLQFEITVPAEKKREFSFTVLYKY